MRGLLISESATERSTIDDVESWQLHPRVALRPEPFGALAYHYDNRRLNFVRSHDLVSVLECLGEAASIRDALDAAGVEPARRSSFRRALQQLADGDFIEPRPPESETAT